MGRLGWSILTGTGGAKKLAVESYHGLTRSETEFPNCEPWGPPQVGAKVISAVETTFPRAEILPRLKRR